MKPWLRPTPTGRPYQQLGRTDVHRWWRPIVGLLIAAGLAVVAVAGFVLAIGILAWGATGEFPRMGEGEEIFADNDLATMIVTIGSIALLLPIVWLVVVLVERRGIGTLSSVAGHVRWRWLALCFAPAVAYMLAVLGTSYLVDFVGLSFGDAGDDESGDWVGWDAFWPALLVIVALVPFQAAAEEYVFRGWLLQAIGSFTFEARHGALGRRLARIFRTPWPAVLVTSALFTAGHGYSDWGPVDVGVFALVTCWVVIVTGGLEAGIALHIVNNIVSMSLDASEGDVSLSQGAIPFSDVVVDTIPMVLWAVLVVWMFRHTGSKRPMKRLS
jgi:membrane protease YdiL (CAAX protease family)